MKLKSTFIAAPFLITTSAIALAAEPAPEAPDAVGGDIIVTAQKREQRITDVPIAMSAYDAKFLNQIDATELTRVSQVTPGFVIQLQDRFAPGFSIRGVTSNDFSPQSEQRVAVFQDGVAVTQAPAAYGEIFDIDRIEVEKGPQSTLHGRSALNGGVSMFQKRATDEFSVEARGGIGNYDFRLIQGVVNVPLTDTLAIRFGGSLRQRDGFVKDIYGGPSYNGVNAQAYRFAGRWEPTSNFSFNLIATYDRDNTKGAVPFKSGTFVPLDQTTGAVIGDLNFWSPTHLNTFGTIDPSHFHRQIVGVSGTAELRMTDQFSLTSISGYRWFTACETGDSDGTPTNILAVDQCNGGKQYSEELRLNFQHVGPFEGFLGASYFKAKNHMEFGLGYDERAMALMFSGALQNLAPRGLTNNEINALLGPMANRLKPFHLDWQNSTADIDTFDVFADVTAHVTDRLEVFAGGRVTFDSKQVGLQGLVPTGPSNLTGGGILLPITPNQSWKTDSNDSTVLTGRAGARYSLSPNANLYVVYGIGKRPEVLNVNAAKANEVLPAEKLSSIEGGVKVRLMGGKLVADASVYHFAYDNFQTMAVVDGKLAPLNAGKASATGAEAQINWAINPYVSVFGSYGYNHARFTTGAYDGNRFRNSPDHKFAIGANFEAPIGEGSLSLAPTYSWQSLMYFFDDNDRADLQVRTPAALSDTKFDEFQKGFGLMSAKLTYTAPRNLWSISVIGDNLFDKKHIVDAGNTGDYFGIPTFIGGTRRTVRAEFGIKF